MSSGLHRCTRPATSPPSPAPTAYPYELVTCCVNTNHQVISAYTDGVRLAIGRANLSALDGPEHQSVCTPGTGAYGRFTGHWRCEPAKIRFPSTTQVLGVFVDVSTNVRTGRKNGDSLGPSTSILTNL